MLILSWPSVISRDSANARQPAEDSTVGGAPVALIVRADRPLNLDEAQVSLLALADRSRPSVVQRGLLSHFVDDVHVAVRGDELSVAVVPEQIPEAYRTEDGLVNFQVWLQTKDASKHGSWTVGVRAVSDSNGRDAWVDPIDHSEKVSTPGRISRAMNSQPVSVRVPVTQARKFCSTQETCAEVRGARSAGAGTDVIDLRTLSEVEGSSNAAARRGPPANCKKKRYHYNVVGARKVRPGTIGTSYPVGKDKAWMTYDANSSAKYVATFGGAVKRGSAGADFTDEGSKTFEAGFGFKWAKSSNFRSYRLRIRYERLDRYFACQRSNWTWWAPIRLTGTTGAHALKGSRPRSSIGVKFKSIIGLDLSSERAYNRRAMLTYAITQRGRWMCGNNHDPAYAGKIALYRKDPR